jgi:hypothetical protein
MLEKDSPYILFAVAYCKKMGYQPDEKGVYKAEDLWEGILVKDEYESRNMGRA